MQCLCSIKTNHSYYRNKKIKTTITTLVASINQEEGKRIACCLQRLHEYKISCRHQAVNTCVRLQFEVIYLHHMRPNCDGNLDETGSHNLNALIKGVRCV